MKTPREQLLSALRDLGALSEVELRCYVPMRRTVFRRLLRELREEGALSRRREDATPERDGRPVGRSWRWRYRATTQ